MRELVVLARKETAGWLPRCEHCYEFCTNWLVSFSLECATQCLQLQHVQSRNEACSACSCTVL